MKAVKDMAYNFQSQKYLPHSLHESKRRFYLCAQGQFVTTQACLEQFQNLVDVIEHSGGSIRHDKGIEKIIATERGKNLSTMTSSMKEELKRDAQGRYLVIACFLLGADRSRFGRRLIENLDFLQGQNNYPTTASYCCISSSHQLEAARVTESCAPNRACQ